MRRRRKRRKRRKRGYVVAEAAEVVKVGAAERLAGSIAFAVMSAGGYPTDDSRRFAAASAAISTLLHTSANVGVAAMSAAEAAEASTQVGGGLF